MSASARRNARSAAGVRAAPRENSHLDPIGGHIVHEHDHDHDHGTVAPHSHPHTNYAAAPHPQHVVLDIGGDIGALIVHTDPELLGLEVEISPAGADHVRSHKQVLERTTGGEPAYVLVFDNLREGEYTLWLDGVARTRRARVSGGSVAELDWRAVHEEASLAHAG